MSGHSKWSNTKHKKAIKDEKKSKIFTKIIRDIVVASKKNGKDPDKNHHLRSILEKAYLYNMKKNTIDNAIKRGSGIYKNKKFQEIRYSSFGPKGIVLVIDCITTNKNRTVSSLRKIFSKFNFELKNFSNFSYIFDIYKNLKFLKKKNEEEKIIEIALKNNILNIITDEKKYFIISTTLENFKKIKNKFIKYSLIPEKVEMIIKPKIFLKLTTEEKEKFLKLINEIKNLEENDKIYHNVLI